MLWMYSLRKLRDTWQIVIFNAKTQFSYFIAGMKIVREGVHVHHWTIYMLKDQIDICLFSRFERYICCTLEERKNKKRIRWGGLRYGFVYPMIGLSHIPILVCNPYDSQDNQKMELIMWLFVSKLIKFIFYAIVY